MDTERVPLSAFKSHFVFVLTTNCLVTDWQFFLPFACHRLIKHLIGSSWRRKSGGWGERRGGEARRQMAMSELLQSFLPNTCSTWTIACAIACWEWKVKHPSRPMWCIKSERCYVLLSLPLLFTNCLHILMDGSLFSPGERAEAGTCCCGASFCLIPLSNYLNSGVTRYENVKVNLCVHPWIWLKGTGSSDSNSNSNSDSSEQLETVRTKVN